MSQSQSSSSTASFASSGSPPSTPAHLSSSQSRLRAGSSGSRNYHTPVRLTSRLASESGTDDKSTMSGNTTRITSASFSSNNGSSDATRSLMGSTATPSRPRCLVGCAGSVATLKVPELVVELSKFFEVLVVCTTNSHFFLKRAEDYNKFAWQDFERIGGWNVVLQDCDEWEMWNKIGHDVLHIELRRWADVFVIAPASANLISKASVGICDNLLLSIMRAWDFHKPCVLCPAMNTYMWDHPATNPSMNILKSWGWQIVGPVEKMLACKEVGNGAMASVESIVLHLLSLNIVPQHAVPSSADKRLTTRGFMPIESTIHPLQVSNITTQHKDVGLVKKAQVIVGEDQSRNQGNEVQSDRFNSKRRSKGLIVGLSLLLMTDIAIRWLRTEKS